MGKIIHADPAGSITEAEYQAESEHIDSQGYPAKLSRSATLVVAASDASDNSKAGADYVCDGTADDVQIQAAIDALPASGGKVVLSEGIFNIDVAIDNNAIHSLHVEGMGTGATFVKTTTAAMYAFDFGDGTTSVSNLSISNMSIGTTITKTAGAMIRFNKVFNSRVSDVYIHTPYIGIDLQIATLIYLNRIYIHQPVVTNGIGVRIDGVSNDQHLNEVFVAGDSANRPAVGFQIIQTAAIHMAHSDAIYCIDGLSIAPTNAKEVTWGFFNGSAFDTNTHVGININPAAGGTVRGLTFVNCWTATNTQQGILTGTTGTIDGVRFIGAKVFNNGSYAVYHQGGINVSFDSCDVAGNVHGITIGSDVVGWNITNSRIGQQAGFGNTQGYNILLLGSGWDNFLIENNDLRGFITAATASIPTASSTKICRNNLGHATENSGTATVLNTTTSIAVAHGLAATPTRIQITPRENPTNAVSFWWVDTIGATNFTINVNADPGASNLDFDWHAQVGEG